jgi:RimJ/RimL family protein N-acetyltransferase
MIASSGDLESLLVLESFRSSVAGYDPLHTQAIQMNMLSNAPNFLPLGSADRGWLLDLFRDVSLRAALYPADLPPPSPQQAVGEWLEAPSMADARLAMWLDGVPVGVIATEAGTVSYAVAAPYRGQGLASAALEAIGAEQDWRATVARSNGPSRRVLEKAGFSFAGLVQSAHGIALLNFYRRRTQAPVRRIHQHD